MSNYYIEKDAWGRPKVGSQVYKDKRIGKRLLDITGLVNGFCCSTSELLDFEKFYILLDQQGAPISGTVTKIKPTKVKFSEITQFYVLALCCDNVITQMTIENFNSISISEYPVGVFSYTGDYIGDAASDAQFASLWNSNSANIAKATIYPTATPFTFNVVLKDQTFTGPLVGLNYFDTKFLSSGTVALNLDNNSVAVTKSNNAVFYSNNFSSVPSSTNLFYDFTSPYEWHLLPTFNYRDVSVTGYTGGSVLRVYHNQSDTIFGHEYTNLITSISGKLPTGLKYYFSSGNTALDYNGITNAGSLTNLLWWTSDHFGGGGALALSKINSNIQNLHQLKGLWIGELITIENAYTLTWLNATNFPVLTDLNISNSLSMASYDATWWGNLPKVTNLLEIRLNTAGVGATFADQVWNGIGTLLASVTPVGANKKIIITGTASVTAASLTARNALITAGWTLVMA